MLGALRTRAAQIGRQVRRMSSNVNHEEEVKEMKKWKMVTYAAIPVCILKGVYDLSHAHAHDADVPAYPYLKIRSKPFPFKDGDTGLFENKHH